MRSIGLEGADAVRAQKITGTTLLTPSTGRFEPAATFFVFSAPGFLIRGTTEKISPAMPHTSRFLPVLLLFAGCWTPGQEPNAGAAGVVSRRAWRSPDRPIASHHLGLTDPRSLRSWARIHSGEVEEQPVIVVHTEPEPIEPESVEVIFEAPLPAPESEPAQEAPEPVAPEPVTPEPVETPEPEEEPAATETPAPIMKPAPPEAPLPEDSMQLVDLRASIVLEWYFQCDDDPSSLERSELEQSFLQYDWNKNGVVIELEFEATTGSSAHYAREPQGEALELMRNVKPLDALLAAVDADGDGAFSLNELLAFHDRRFAREAN